MVRAFTMVKIWKALTGDIYTACHNEYLSKSINITYARILEGSTRNCLGVCEHSCYSIWAKNHQYREIFGLRNAEYVAISRASLRSYANTPNRAKG